MSWIGEHVTQLEAWAKELLGHADEKVHAIGQDLARVAGELRGDAPKLEAEAVQDAADVVHTAETQGVAPAETQAAADAVTLAEHAGHDVAAAVEGSHKAADADPAETSTPSA